MCVGADGRYASNPGRNFTMCADRLVGAAFTSVPTPGGFENPINGSGGEIDLGKNNRGVSAPTSLGRGLLWFRKKMCEMRAIFLRSNHNTFFEDSWLLLNQHQNAGEYECKSSTTITLYYLGCQLFLFFLYIFSVVPLLFPCALTNQPESSL